MIRIDLKKISEAEHLLKSTPQKEHYNTVISQDDGYLSIFDGQKEIHGVMPISQIETNPYRASIVYYSLEQMKHCYPYKEELARLQKKASERALKRKGH